MVANEFRLLKAFIEVDTKGFRRVSARLDKLELQVKEFSSRGGLISVGVSRRARRQIDTLILKLKEARRLSRGIVVLGGAGGGVAGAAAGGVAGRPFTGVGGGRVAQAATFGLLANNLRGQVGGIAQSSILGTAAGGVAAGAGIGAVIGTAVAVKRSAEVAANFQDIEVALKGIVGDENKVAKLIEDLRDVSLETDLNFFTDLLPSSIGLLGSGFTTEEIPRLQRQLADLSIITSRNGVSFDELSQKVARNKTQYRQLTRDVREYTNAGLNILPSLQKQLGVVGNEAVFAAVEEGNVTIENILQALTDLTSEGGVAFNLQANAADNLNFQMQKLGENVTFVAAEFGNKLIPSLTDAAKAFNELFVDPPEITAPIAAQPVTRAGLDRLRERSAEEARLVRRQRELQAEVARLEDEQARRATRNSFAAPALQVAGAFLGFGPNNRFGQGLLGTNVSGREVELLRTQISELQREIINIRQEQGLDVADRDFPDPRERDPFAEIIFGVPNTEAALRTYKRGVNSLAEGIFSGDFLKPALGGAAAAGLGLAFGGASGAVRAATLGAQADPGQLKAQGQALAQGIAEGDISLFNPAELAIFKELPLSAKIQSAASKGFETAVKEFGKFVGDLEAARVAAEGRELIIEVRRAGNL